MDIYLASSMRREQLAHQLIQMAVRETDFREKSQTAQKPPAGGNQAMEDLHSQNTRQLREIIAEIGWPTRSKVGEQASDAAWFIVQHAIGEPAFMRGCYALMQLVESDINPVSLAYLHDRICYFSGRPQRYGTQSDGNRLYPVEDTDSLNSLRAGLKLPPIPESRIHTAGECANGKAMQDLHTDPIFNAWRKKVGWV
ncbi:DUF6624 domain-containing protein [Dyadobacter beijingensis]|nr:DUF6624 domain-containing protein [Dyadobacter beijingensis]